MYICFRGCVYFNGVEFMCPNMINFCSLDGVNPSMLEGLWCNTVWTPPRLIPYLGFNSIKFLVSLRGITLVPVTYINNVHIGDPP